MVMKHTDEQINPKRRADCGNDLIRRRTTDLLCRCRKAAESGDRKKHSELAWEIVLLNQGLIHSVAQKLYALCRCAERAMELEELVSAGYDGMCYAISKFVPDYGCRFSTFAYRQVFGSILCYIKENNGIIPVPLYKQHRLHRMKKASEKLAGRGVHPTPGAIAAELHCSETEIEELLLLPSTDISFDSVEARHHTSPALAETVTDDTRNPPDAELAENMQSHSLKAIMQAVLTERQYCVLSLRYGLDSPDREGKTLQQVGSDLSLTRERVRQIEHESFELLRLLSSIGQAQNVSQTAGEHSLLDSLNTLPCLMDNKFSFKLVSPANGQPLLLENKYSFTLVRPENALPVVMNNRHSFRFIKPVMVKPAVRRKWFKKQTKGKTLREKGEMVKNLTAYEQSVLSYRYGLRDRKEKSLREVAGILRVKLLKVWKIEQKALEKLMCEWGAGKGCWAEIR